MGKTLAEFEQDRLDAKQNLVNRAHNRFMQSRRNFIESNPNAVSPWERQKTLDEFKDLQERDKVRGHQLDMQRTVNEGLIGAAAAQGREAASVRASADKEIARMEHGYIDYKGDRQKGSREILAEMDAQSKERIAQMGQKTELERIKAENGWMGDDGTWNQGRHERVENIRGTSMVEAERERAKGLAAQAEANNNAKRLLAELNNEARLEQARIAAGGKVSSTQMKSAADIVKSALTANGNSLNPKQASEVLKDLMEQYKNNPDMLSAFGIVSQTMGIAPQDVGGTESQTVVTGKDGKKYVLVRDKNGNVIGRKPVQ